MKESGKGCWEVASGNNKVGDLESEAMLDRARFGSAQLVV